MKIERKIDMKKSRCNFSALLMITVFFTIFTAPPDVSGIDFDDLMEDSSGSSKSKASPSSSSGGGGIDFDDIYEGRQQKKTGDVRSLLVSKNAEMERACSCALSNRGCSTQKGLDEQDLANQLRSMEQQVKGAKQKTCSDWSRNIRDNTAGNKEQLEHKIAFINSSIEIFGKLDSNMAEGVQKLQAEQARRTDQAARAARQKSRSSNPALKMLGSALGGAASNYVGSKMQFVPSGNAFMDTTMRGAIDMQKGMAKGLVNDAITGEDTLNSYSNEDILNDAANRYGGALSSSVPTAATGNTITDSLLNTGMDINLKAAKDATKELINGGKSGSSSSGQTDSAVSPAYNTTAGVTMPDYSNTGGQEGGSSAQSQNSDYDDLFGDMSPETYKKSPKASSSPSAMSSKPSSPKNSTKYYTFSYRCGQSDANIREVKIPYKTQQCLTASKEYTVVSNCNMKDKLSHFKEKCQSACSGAGEKCYGGS